MIMKTINFFELYIDIHSKKLQETLGYNLSVKNFVTLSEMESYINELYNRLKDEYKLVDCVMWYYLGKKVSFNYNGLNCVNFINDKGISLDIDFTARQIKLNIY